MGNCEGCTERPPKDAVKERDMKLAHVDYKMKFEGLQPIPMYWTAYNTPELIEKLGVLVEKWKAALRSFKWDEEAKTWNVIDWAGEMKILNELFHLCDLNGDHLLQWSTGEVHTHKSHERTHHGVVAELHSHHDITKSSELRMYIRKMFAHHRLPEPPLSLQVWQVLYREHEHENANDFDLHRSISFLILVAETIFLLASGRAKPAEVAPGVFLTYREEYHSFDTHPQPTEDELREQRRRMEDQARQRALEEQRAREEALRQQEAEEAKRRKAIEDMRRAAEEEQRKLEEIELNKLEAQRALEKAQQMAEEERRHAQAAREAAELERQRQQEMERKAAEQRRAELERKLAEEELRRQQEERRVAEERVRELARKKAEEAEQIRAEKERLAKMEEERKRRLEEERLAEEARQIAEQARQAEEARMEAERQKRQAEEARKLAEEEKRRAEEERRRLEMQRKRAEEEAKAAYQARLAAEADAKRKALELARQKELAEQQKQAEEAARKKREFELRMQHLNQVWRSTKTAIRVTHEWYKDYQEHLPKLREIVDDYHVPEIQIVVRRIFDEADKNSDGSLEWNNSEIRHFINLIFQYHGLPAPNMEEGNWYQLYRKFDQDRNYKLNFEECCEFAKMLMEECSKRSPEQLHMLPSQYQNKPALLEKLANWEDERNRRAIIKVFQQVDRDNSKQLTWNDSEVRNFIRKVFEALNLPMPRLPENVWYQLYREVDIDGNYTLSADEASDFVKHVIERILDFYPEWTPRTPRLVRE